jgi:hypothetical protein
LRYAFLRGSRRLGVLRRVSGYGISHVGIATGYGTVIHASTYYGAVVETPIEYIPGYVGAVDAY